MNIIELSFVFCACISSVFCCGICYQDIKEKYKANPNKNIKIKTPRFFTSSFSATNSAPLIDSSELGPLVKDTAESITDQEDIRAVLRQ